MGAWVQVNLNPHEFGRNSPVNYFDPFGEADCPGGLGPGSLNPENLEALQTPAQALRQAVIRKLQQSKIYGKGLEGAKKIDPAKLKDLLTRGELEQAKQVAKEGIQKAKDLIKNTTNEKTRKAALEALETQLTRLEACVKASGL
jgi:hypothetical protein